MSSRSEALYDDVRARTRAGLSEAFRKLSDLLSREDELAAMLEQGVHAEGWSDEERERWWREHPRPERSP